MGTARFIATNTAHRCYRGSDEVWAGVLKGRAIGMWHAALVLVLATDL